MSIIDRLRVIAHAKRAGRSGESIDLPVMEFPGFASQEVETLVVYTAPIELTLNPVEAFAAFAFDGSSRPGFRCGLGEFLSGASGV